MIIGLELVCIISWLIGGLLLVSCIIFAGLRKTNVAVVFAAISTTVMVLSLFIYGSITSVQADVEDHYIDYLRLQIQVAQYDDLDMLEQFKVRDDVMTYNLWYERNKSDLENEWTFKGTSSYAKEFDYIVIGG